MADILPMADISPLADISPAESTDWLASSSEGLLLVPVIECGSSGAVDDAAGCADKDNFSLGWDLCGVTDCPGGSFEDHRIFELGAGDDDAGPRGVYGWVEEVLEVSHHPAGAQVEAAADAEGAHDARTASGMITAITAAQRSSSSSSMPCTPAGAFYFLFGAPRDKEHERLVAQSSQSVPRLLSIWMETNLPQIEGVSIHEGFFELESMVMDMSVGLPPRFAPSFIRRLAAADGGLVHSRSVTMIMAAIHMRTSLRFFAIDVLKSGLSTPTGRAFARRALTNTRFAAASDDDLRIIYQQLLAPETVLNIQEIKGFLRSFSGQELKSFSPGLVNAVKTHLHLPCLGRSFIKMAPMPKARALYDGEMCPSSLVEEVEILDGFVDSRILGVILDALRLGDPQVPRRKSIPDAVEELSENLLACLTIDETLKFL